MVAETVAEIADHLEAVAVSLVHCMDIDPVRSSPVSMKIGVEAHGAQSLRVARVVPVKSGHRTVEIIIAHSRAVMLGPVAAVGDLTHEPGQ